MVLHRTHRSLIEHKRFLRQLRLSYDALPCQVALIKEPLHLELLSFLLIFLFHLISEVSAHLTLEALRVDVADDEFKLDKCEEATNLCERREERGGSHCNLLRHWLKL
jgi:hypothetical protein